MSVSERLPLQDRIIVVTRPPGQGDALCRMIEAEGGTAIALPALLIEPVPVRGSIFGSQLAAADMIIFCSPNAVIHGLPLLVAVEGPLPVLLGIGAGTARKLEAHGYGNVRCAGSRANSEALLRIPELQERRVRGKRLVIIKGRNGRTLLVHTLVKRGAQVDCIEVYRRILPYYPDSRLRQLWRQQPDAILVSSNEGLENLLEFTPPDVRPHLLQTTLVVFGRRGAERARELGYSGTILLAKSTSDEGFIQALSDTYGELFP